MIYLNGEFMPIEQARVPVLDRGSSSRRVYEVIPGTPGILSARRASRRLQASLDGIRLANPHDDAEGLGWCAA